MDNALIISECHLNHRFFPGLGLSSGVVMFLQGLMFGISGEQLTMRLRTRAFSSMLRQEMGWFDLPNNSTGALCTRLSNDAAMVQGATGARIGSVLQGLAGFTIAIGEDQKIPYARLYEEDKNRISLLVSKRQLPPPIPSQ